MKTGITKQYDGNFPERNLVSNQEQGAQLPQFSQYLVDEINGYQHIRDGWIEGSKDYEVYDLMVRVLRKAADKYIELESYRTQSTEVKTQPESAVWVKASERIPKDDSPNYHVRLNGVKVNGNFYDRNGEGEIGFGVSGGGLFEDYLILPKDFDRIEWLDESKI